MKAWVKDLEEQIASGDIEHAMAIVFAQLDKSADDSIDLLRKAGVFRFARYNFESKCLTKLIKSIIEKYGKGLSECSRSYCESLLALSTLSPDVRSLYKTICASINARSFKSYLVTIDRLFREKQEGQQLVGFEHVFASWRAFPREELADAFSYYCSLLHEHARQPTHEELSHLNLKKVQTNYYLEQLSDLAKIIRFREAEMLVAFFPFSAKVADKAVILQADCDDLEKSIRWGYIRHADQIKGDFEALRESFEANLPAQTNGLISTLEDAVKWFVDRLGDTAFVRVDWPVSRIQFHLPISDKFKQMFDSDTGWLDEAHTVSSALKALFITLEDLRKIQIHKSITLHDVLRFQRVGKFVCEAFEEYAHRNKLHNSPIYLRSIVGHLPEASAFTIARELCGIEKPEDLYELLCANEQFTGVFDVLYRPVFRFGGEYLFPGGIIAYSNIMRNALHAAKFRFDSTESVDPITERLVRTFNRVGVKAISRVDYSFAGQKGEVDVLVVIGDQLFAFECKNSLHPCNTHELRQSYGYAINGFEQLGKLRRLFERPDFAHYMREKTGLAMQNITGLTTCVVTGNRMFTGYEVNGHAVRNVYEIENAIMGGAAQFSFAKDLLHPNGEYETFRFRFWNGKQLEANDLIDYIQRDSLHQIAFRAMKSSVQVIPFGRRELRFKSFLLDVQDFAEELRRHARVEIAPSSEPL